VPLSALPAPEREGSDPMLRWGSTLQRVVVLACLAGVSAGFGTTVLILSLVGAGLLVVGLSQPRLGVLGLWLLVALDPFNKNELIAAPVWRYNTTNLLLGAMLVSQLPRVLRRREPHTAALLLLLTVMVVMLESTPDLAEGIDQLVATAAPLAMVAICARPGADAATWRAAAMTTGVLGAFAGPLYYLRGGGAELNANVVAFAFLAPLALVTAVAIVVPLTRRDRSWLLILACCHVASVFLTGSRGALLVALLSLCALGLAGADAGQRLMLGAAVIAAVLVLLTQVTASQSLTLRRIEKLFDSSQELDDRTSSRTKIIRNGMAVFDDNPGGIGTGGFRSATTVVEDINPQERDAHAAWVKVLVENGVIGGGLLVVYVGSFAVAGRGLGRRRLALGVTATVVLGVSLTTSEFGAKGLWVFPVAATVLLHDRPRSTDVVA
jgi:hypothetical protein